MSQVVIATGNRGKVAELALTLSDLKWQCRPQSDFDVPEAIEDGKTFLENAIIKARNACQHTGLPSIADDSGIEVDALNNQPGIYTARYASRLQLGESQNDANIRKLLHSLAGIENRRARFYCALVYLRHAKDPTPVVATASWFGEIAHQPSGSGGFGYDPIFFVPELNCCAAELCKEQKQQLSHRGKALHLLLKNLTHETSST